MKNKSLYSIIAIALAVACPGMFAQSANAQLSGAIWTTTHNGRVVNGNIYRDKCDVYLNGGPGPNAPIGAAGLPMGWYYFMVTDPSGKVLLSNDAITERRIWVSEDGVFVEKVWGGDGRTYPIHVYNDDKGEKDGFGAIVVQLCPYDDTPNNGGVYKAWITPVDKYDPTEGKHGFIPRWSKTDNFKVGKKPPDQWLYVRKFKDCNANGLRDATEDWLAWDVKITPPEGLGWTEQTPAKIMAWEGQWSVEELIPSGWLQTALLIDGVSQTVSETATVTFGTRDETHYVDFGNIPTGRITACKFYDSDADGERDEGEVGIEGVKMTLTGSDVLGDVGPLDLYTGSGGCVTFNDLLPGTYIVTETPPPPTSSCGWVSTTPTTSEPIILACEEGAEGSAEFGNIITGTACFSTKGFWHNKNGLTELTQDDIDYVSGFSGYDGLAPYKAPPSDYFDDGDEPFEGTYSDGTPVEAAIGDGIWNGVEVAPAGSAKAEVSQFLVDNNGDADLHGHKEQLAQQLLAFIFNVRNRLGGETAVILEPGLWEGPAIDLINEAVAAWVVGGDAALRDYYKGILDSLNNRHCDPGVNYVFPEPPESCLP
jgi:hypothetical protein